MFDEHHGRVRAVEHVAHRADDLVHTVRVEVGGGFVQQQDAGLHGERPGEGEALHLPAAQVHGGTVKLDAVHADRVEAVADALPDRFARHVEVFRAERDIVAESFENRLRIRVLQYEADAPPGLADGRAVDGDTPLGQSAIRVNGAGSAVSGGIHAFDIAAEQSGRTFENSGFADAGRPKQQHALAGFDTQVEAADGEMAA